MKSIKMKRFYHLFFVFYSLLLTGVVPVSAQEVEEEGPTMGWSSWNTYGVNISGDLIKRQALAVNIVHDTLQTIGEASWVNQQLSRLGIAAAKITIVDIDKLISRFLELLGHGKSLTLDEISTDVDAIGVP